MRLRRTVLATLLAVVAPLVVHPDSAVATAPHDPILGSGSTWAANAVGQWVVDVYNTSDRLRVDYSAVGSARGRQEFAIPKTDFAVAEQPYVGVDPAGNPDTSNGRDLAYVPIVAGGVAITYHLDVDGSRVDDLRLSGETVAKIFTGRITSWDDPAITRDNDGHALPSLPIYPVVHSEGAAETSVLTSWMSRRFPSLWGSCGGSSTGTQYYPLNCGRDSGNMKAFNGSDGIMNFIRSDSANGAITYLPYSYPLLAGYPVAPVGNAAGAYVSPNARGVWTALHRATVNDDGTIDQRSVFDSTDREAYPLSYVAYAFIPTASDDAFTKTTGARQTLADFLHHAICQGQSEISSIGYAPLPLNLVQTGIAHLTEVGAADPDVDLTDDGISTCDNPTFDPATLVETPPPGPTVAPEPPVAIGKPTISGLPKVGFTLRASTPSAESGVRLTYAWRADNRAIPGAHAATYVPRVTDVDTFLSVTVTPHRSGVAGRPRTSDHTTAIVPNPVAIRRPSVAVDDAPTTTGPGSARVTIRPSSGHARIDGPTDAVVTLTLGRTRVERVLSVRFRDGVAVVPLPRLTRKGAWSAAVTLGRSDLIKRAARSRTFTVRVAR